MMQKESFTAKSLRKLENLICIKTVKLFSIFKLGKSIQLLIESILCVCEFVYYATFLC